MSSPEFGFKFEWEDGQVRVFLPHQCEDWDISGISPYSYAEAVPVDEAIDRLAQFIREATDLLWELKNERDDMQRSTDATTRP